MTILTRLLNSIIFILGLTVVVYSIRGMLTVTRGEDSFECLNLGISKMQARQAFASGDMKAYKQAKVAIKQWSLFCKQ